MDNWKWNTGAVSRSINLPGSGKFWVSSTAGCDSYIDSFNATMIPFRTTSVASDTLICFQNTARIIAPDSFNRYYWLGGCTDRDTVLYKQAILYLTAIDDSNCRTFKQRSRVEFINYINQPHDSLLCNSDTIIIDAEVNYPSVHYLWHTGDTLSKLKVATPGQKIIRIAAKGCALTDTIQVDKIDLQASIGEDKTICEGEEITLKSVTDNADYLWSTGATTQSITVNTSNTYKVTITKGTCSANAMAEVRFINCKNCIAIPNAFTPNKDGINDYFKPLINCPVKHYQMKIMNRWGQEVFTSSSPNNGWDGAFKGYSLEGNTYFYLLKVVFDLQVQDEQIFSGDITLIR